MNSALLREGWGLPNTLLGFETTGPSSLRPFGGTGGDVTILLGVGPGDPGLVCCCPAWWWGVVFDSCIVVASINSRKVAHLSFVLGECFVWVVVV